MSATKLLIAVAACLALATLGCDDDPEVEPGPASGGSGGAGGGSGGATGGAGTGGTASGGGGGLPSWDNEEVLAYDDDTAENGTAPMEDVVGGNVGVRFTPPASPFQVTEASFFVHGSLGADPSASFRVRVYRFDEQAGEPGAEVLTEEVNAESLGGGTWVSVDLQSHGLVVDDGDFVVAMEWTTAAGPSGIDAQVLGVDILGDPDGRTWFMLAGDGIWHPITDLGGDKDAMIRATVGY